MENNFGTDEAAEKAKMEDVDMNDVILDLKDGRKGVEQIIDHLKVQWNLAKMEGRDQKQDIIDKLETFKRNFSEQEKEVISAWQSFEVQSHLGLMEAEEQWAEIKSKITHELNEKKELMEKKKDDFVAKAHQADLPSNLSDVRKILRKTSSRMKSNIEKFADTLKLH